ncbi:hypothetical protein RB653_005056 [Dictyostelium firmibasis]|uniref:Leucine-rich repeat-containing protein n=1 Tax=Dictyostelium firmibasis TaxID=79012 RepID=A0AAN7YYX0_9MYCE
MFSFVYSLFSNNVSNEPINNNEDDEYEDDYSDDSINDSKNKISENQVSTKENRLFPNYLIITILNMILSNQYRNGIEIEHDSSEKSDLFNQILKLTLVSKTFQNQIIPHLHFPMFILRGSKDITYVQRLIKRGITPSGKNPFININQINIDLPNECRMIELNSTINVFKYLLLFGEDLHLEKLKISTALVPRDIDSEITRILVEFILKHQIKELELHNIPAIKTHNFIENKSILNYSLLSNRVNICGIQHLCLKNQLLSCDTVMDLIELIPKLHILDLTNNRIGLDYKECFTNVIGNANLLTVLKLSSNVLKDNVSQLLPTLKSSCFQLHTLDISENYITNESTKSINDFIQSNKIIQSLNLSGNSFTELGVNSIFSSLVQNNSITDLSLSNYQTFNTTLFAEYLSSNSSNKLKSLNLSNSKILCPSNLIFQSLSINFKSIKSLDLSYCSINNDDSQLNQLSEYLNSNDNCKLERLKLLKTFKDSIPCKMLFSNLSKSITDLDISLNYLNNENSIDFSTILETNKSIRSLNLTSTNIRNLSALFNSLKLNSTLLFLNLSNNAINLQDIYDYEFLIVNKSLISLNLSNNSIENREMTQFFRILSKNRSIKYLDISENHLGGDIVFPTFKRRNQKLSLDIKVSPFLKNNLSLNKMSKNIIVDQNKPYSITRYDTNNEGYITLQKKTPNKRMAY